MSASVLIADDEPHILEVVRAYLERDGYAVVTAEDGEAALRLARELVARIGAVLRRVRADQGGAPAGAAGLALGDLVVDRTAREVRRAGARVDLTRTEFDLLAAFAEQPSRVWTREQLGEALFGQAFDAFDRAIDSHVKNLRRKLDPAPDGASYVETLRGVGYRAWRPAERP